jgi:threonine dehydrogenase-like Zn-dependent dehydrogenase
MGRLHLALARTWGASAVSLIDVSPDRLKRAERYGATRTAHPDDALEVCGEQDVVVVTAPAGVDLAVEMAAVGGTVVLFSAFDDDVQAAVGADRSHREEVAIVGAYSQEPEDWRLASSLIRSGLIAEDLDGLITATFDFDTIVEALTLVTSEPTFRVFVEPPEPDA